MKTEDERWIAYRVKILPDQLERARRRVLHLEREAERLGMRDLLHDKTKGGSKQVAVS